LNAFYLSLPCPCVDGPNPHSQTLSCNLWRYKVSRHFRIYVFHSFHMKVPTCSYTAKQIIPFIPHFPLKPFTDPHALFGFQTPLLFHPVIVELLTPNLHIVSYLFSTIISPITKMCYLSLPQAEIYHKNSPLSSHCFSPRLGLIPIYVL